MKPIEILTKQLLYKEYIFNKLSIAKIAQKYDIKSKNSVTQLLKKYGLSRESIVRSKILTKDILIQKYVNENKSIKTVTQELGYKSKEMITSALDKYKIPRRKFTKSILKNRESKKRRKGFKGISGKYFASLISGAKRRKINFNITIDYIWWLYKKQKGRCALSNDRIRFNKVEEKFTCQTASLDRIDSKKGYIIGNVQWIHKTVQKIKMNLDEHLLVEFCSKIAKHKGKK